MYSLKKEINVDEFGKTRMTVEGLAQILALDPHYLHESIESKALNKIFLEDGATQTEIDCWLVGGIPDVMVPLIFIHFATAPDNVSPRTVKYARKALNYFYNIGLEQIENNKRFM